MLPSSGVEELGEEGDRQCSSRDWHVPAAHRVAWHLRSVLWPTHQSGTFLVLYVKYFFLAKFPMACSGSSLTIEIDGCLRKTLTCFEI